MTQRVAIVGPGLLGGSLAFALKAKVGAHVRVWARRTSAVDDVMASGCADAASVDLAEVVRDADVIVFATPVGVMAKLAREMTQHLKEGALVTDVGSVKGPVCRELGGIFANGPAHFVGSHPMAGSEQTGLSFARADLFAGAVCIVTPMADTPPEVASRAGALWESVGGLVRILDPDEHDGIVASISHLPHLLAAILVNSVAESEPKAFEYCGPGFRDTSRVAGGPPDMWTEILAQNRGAVRKALDGVIEKLQAASTILAADSPERDLLMNQILTQAKAQRDRLRLPKILSDV